MGDSEVLLCLGCNWESLAVDDGVGLDVTFEGIRFEESLVFIIWIIHLQIPIKCSITKSLLHNKSLHLSCNNQW